MPVNVIDAILEIFTWVGFGMAALIGIVALIARIADGSWVPVQAVISDDPHGPIARWFGPQGGVGQARLTHEQEHRIGDRDVADVWVKLGRDDRMRLTKGSHGVRLLVWLTIGFAALGGLAALGSLVMLFVR